MRPNTLWIGLLALLLCAWTSPACAKPRAAMLESGQSSLELDSYLSYRIDPEEQADAVAMFQAQAAGEFQPIPHGNPTFGFGSGAYWLHARIENRGHHEQRWLLVLQYALIDNVDLYVRYPDGRLMHQASGDFLPFSARAIRYRHPNFWITLPQGTRVEILLRASSKSSMQLPLALYTPSAFAELARDAQFGIGLYDGILLALFFYNLVLWLSLRDASYFWYMFHVAGIGLVLFCLNGLAFEYLWPEWPWLANQAIPASVCLAQIGMHQFARHFLELDRRWPLGDRIARIFLLFFVVLGVLSFAIDYRVSVLIGTAAVFPGVLFILYQAIRMFRAGYQPAKLFLFAWALLLLGTAVYALVSFGVLPRTFATEYGVQVGSALEMVLLSFALAYRYAALRAENERIVRDANEQLERNVARRTAELSNALEQLAEANARLREYNRRDSLTGVFNRRYFHEIFERLLRDAREHRHPLALLMADLDHFKAINDSHGHLVGDDCLRWVARQLSETLAPHDALVARFGGEEFVAVLPNMPAHEAERVAETLRQRIATEALRVGEHTIRMTLSVGVFSVQPDRAGSQEDLLRVVDEALYAAKDEGRNCVRSAVSMH